MLAARDGLDLYRRVCGNVVCGRLDGWQLSYFIQCAIGSPAARRRQAGEAMRLARPTASG